MDSVGIIGLGALGTLFADEFKQSGLEPLILADPERAQRLRAQGRTVNGRHIDLTVATPDQGRELSLILVATKFGGLEAAMGTMTPFVGPKTRILSVINGVESENRLAERFGWDRGLLATAQGMDAVFTGSSLTCAMPGKIVLGEREPGPVSERARETADFLNAHHIRAEAVEDMARRQWGKLMLNAGINQAVTVFEGDYGTVQRPGKARECMLGAMREVQTLSGLLGYPISEEEYQGWVALADSLSPEGKPSMRQDAEAGRKTEVELFAGTVVREAARFSLPVPVNAWLYERIREMEAAM